MKKSTTYTPLANLSGQATTEAVGRESDKFMLRLPTGMRERIAEAAKESKRSMNAEIVARLEHTFASVRRAPDSISMALEDALQSIDLYARENGVTPEEALSACVNAALVGVPIAYVVMQPGMRLADVREIMQEAKRVFGEESPAFFVIRDERT